MPRQHPFCIEDYNLNEPLPSVIRRTNSDIVMNLVGDSPDFKLYNVDYGTEQRTWELYKNAHPNKTPLSNTKYD